MFQICLWDIRKKQVLVKYTGNINQYSRLPIHVDELQKIVYTGKYYKYLLLVNTVDFWLWKWQCMWLFCFLLQKKPLWVFTLALLFWRKSQASVIAKSSSSASLLLLSLSLLCKNFNITHYSKSINGINTKLEIFAHHDNVRL